MAFEIVIPRLGWSMEEGTFSGWLKKDGDFVRSGETLFSLEGEKAIQDIESIDEGILRISPNGPNVGTVVKVGTIVGYIVVKGEDLPWLNSKSTEGEEAASVASSQTSTATPVASPSVRRMARDVGIELSQVIGTGPRGRITSQDVMRARSPAADKISARIPANMPATSACVDLRDCPVAARDKWSQATGAGSRVIASPRARRVARELNVDWKLLRGSGANGRVRERDVREAGTQVVTFGVRQPITTRRRIIAERLTFSRQRTVPVTLTTKADATKLIALRSQWKSRSSSSSVPSYQDIIIKLIAEIMTRHPRIAGRWEQDAIVIPREHEMNIGMAVDTEDGLLVPVIQNVNGLTLGELAEKSHELVERARVGKLVASEMQSGVFTVTNLGSFGIDAFTPVINLPESAILGLGAIRMEPAATPAGKIIARHTLSLSLTFNHRIIDGAPAARFLQELVTAIADLADL